jgi:hypothetical protein
LAIGLALAAIPLLHFGGGLPFIGGGHHHPRSGSDAPMVAVQPADHRSTAGPHMDHEPHHGGQLGMVGDFHIELVEIGDSVEIYLSDAERRPLPPTSGTIVFDTGTWQPLARGSTFLRAPTDKNAEEVTVKIATSENAGQSVEISFLLLRTDDD